MQKQSYIKEAELEFVQQLLTFSTNAPKYMTILGLTQDQLTAQTNDAKYMEYLMTCLDISHNNSKKWTSVKDIMRDGGVMPAAGLPLTLTFPTPVPPVDADIEGRFRDLVKDIKKHPNYNEAIGKELGIEGIEVTPPDYNTLQPDLKLDLRNNGVYIHWNFGHYRLFLDQCKIVVDRGDGKGEVLLAMDSTPNYLDTTPFPSAAAKWTYRAVYMYKDQQVGQWSKPVTINVG